MARSDDLTTNLDDGKSASGSREGKTLEIPIELQENSNETTHLGD
jgi:hypothetical protein